MCMRLQEESQQINYLVNGKSGKPLLSGTSVREKVNLVFIEDCTGRLISDL